MNIDLFLKQALLASNKRHDGTPLFFYKAFHPQPHHSGSKIFQAGLCFHGTNHRLLYVQASPDTTQESFVVVPESLQHELAPTLDYFKNSKDMGVPLEFKCYFAAVPSTRFL